MAKTIQLVENRRAMAICETTPRYDVIFRGEKFDQLYFNTRGYCGLLPCLREDGTVGRLDIGEVSISAYKKEVARLNKEWKNS